MKELSIVEKAKAYDEAVINGSRLWECGDITRENYEYIFPELKESEDDKIRKTLIHIVKGACSKYGIKYQGKEISEEKLLAWLEKQGEQNQKHFELKAGHWYICHRAFCCRADHLTVKEGERFMCEKDGVVKGFVFKEPEKYFKEVCPPAPMEDENKSADMVEPKFKVGNWLQYRNAKPFFVEEITKQGYVNGDSCLPFNWENEIHLWTIEDAKDGDVLTFNDGHGNDSIELIKSITDKKIEFWFCLTNGNRYEVFDGIIPYTNLVSREDATPATKEQRDLLFQKMKEAGYEWDAEKKELKKIEQNHSWSEEDEAIYYGVIETELYMLDVVNGIKKFDVGNISIKEECARELNWLKSFKDRIQPQPKQEWSDEDKGNLLDVKCIINEICHSQYIRAEIDHPEEELESLWHWLNNLWERVEYPKNTWKPSEEQMKALSSISVTGTISYAEQGQELIALYNDLRK